jgi:hypothetical protein
LLIRRCKHGFDISHIKCWLSVSAMTTVNFVNRRRIFGMEPG